MKSRAKYDAVATTGKYKDKQTGEEKKQYTKVGTVIESEDGRLSLKLDVIPVGPNWSGYISFYPVKERDQQQRPEPKSRVENLPDSDDDIPF